MEDNSKIIFIFLNKNIRCDPSLELSQRDGSYDGYNICFKGVVLKTIHKLSLLPLLIWRTDYCYNEYFVLQIQILGVLEMDLISQIHRVKEGKSQG